MPARRRGPPAPHLPPPSLLLPLLLLLLLLLHLPVAIASPLDLSALPVHQITTDRVEQPSATPSPPASPPRSMTASTSRPLPSRPSAPAPTSTPRGDTNASATPNSDSVPAAAPRVPRPSANGTASSNGPSSFPQGLPQVQDRADPAKSKLNKEQCNKLFDLLRKPAILRTPLFKALVALMYFISLAALLFTLILVLRAYCHSVPRPTLIRGGSFFAVLLIVSASVLMVVRHFLLPLDLHRALGLYPSNFANDVAKCEPDFGDRWPDRGEKDLFFGKPAIDGGGFWTLIALAYGTAVALLVWVVYMRVEEEPSADAWKRRKPAFECQCDPRDTECPHR